jgi:hypothetical protein
MTSSHQLLLWFYGYGFMVSLVLAELALIGLPYPADYG